MSTQRTTSSRVLRRFKWLRRPWLLGAISAVAVGVVVICLTLAAVTIWPSVGARGADAMRGLIGDQATASVEGFVLSWQDRAHHVEYALGISRPQAPWSLDSAGAEPPTTSSTITTGPTATTHGGAKTGTTTTTTEPPWQPAPVQALGTLAGEGKWSSYIKDPYGRTVGFRTALQPDPSRPYAVVAVVAVDLTNTRLHFVLGYNEPISDMKISRPGTISQADRTPKRLLAGFNGGFQARHGNYGAMDDGAIALRARDNLGTIVVYRDGRVDLGAWGVDIESSSDMVSWRQNGPLVISHGVINAHTKDDAPEDWGFVLHGGVATWRSGVGLSQDRRTLYYFVGPSLTISALAQAMHQAGVWDGIQLDINKAWTRFDRFAVKNGKLQAQPVLKDINQDNRFLEPYKRDFFYLTAEPPPG
jgi:Phosphodiester glycosidase